MEDLSAIAAAWTELRELAILITPCKLPAHEALLLLAQRCQSLMTLELHGVEFSLTSPADLDAIPVMNHHLRLLLIERDMRTRISATPTAIVDKELTGELVARLFPHLSAFSADHRCHYLLGRRPQGVHSFYDEERELMKIYRAARERRRGGIQE
ncbi:hypothetical protein C8Q76DRAFT_756640 [Earliella scabrosa]|nr:hypothetical protein C8Q76DRAFT_756640 [Earliella scabrosa]